MCLSIVSAQNLRSKQKTTTIVDTIVAVVSYLYRAVGVVKMTDN